MTLHKTIYIDGRPIGEGYPPYVIAEMSANHNGDLSRALELMEAIKKAGADAVKIQTYTADTLTIDHNSEDFQITGGLWDGYSLYQLYEKAALPWEWHQAIFARGRELGIAVFSTPFDESAVDFLEQLGAPAYKIASFEATDHALVARAAASRKPLIISTGMANFEEIGETVKVAREHGARDLILLHCVSAYPAPAEESNLRTIPDLSNVFDVVAGLSDHTLGHAVAVSSVALGAAVIEKHITLRRIDGGVDSAFSLEPDEFADLCSSCKTAWAALGCVNYASSPSQEANRKFRRSLYAVKDVGAGEAFTSHNVRSIRPGYGLPPKHLPEIIGRKAATAIRRGTPISWCLVR